MNDSSQSLSQEAAHAGRPFVLIGMPGCGKSTVAGQLARALGLPKCDTDTLLEQRLGMPISEYFASHGEAAFREHETDALRDALDRGPGVVATGGGIVTVEASRQVLAGARVAYLRVRVDTLVRRLAHDQSRPLLQGSDKESRLQSLLAVRGPLYEQCASIVVDVDQLRPAQVTKALLESWGLSAETKAE